MGIQWTIGTPDLVPAQGSFDQCLEETLWVHVDSLDIEFNLSTNVGRNSRNGDSQQGKARIFIKVQSGWNHYHQVSLATLQGFLFCVHFVLYIYIATQFDGALLQGPVGCGNLQEYYSIGQLRCHYDCQHSAHGLCRSRSPTQLYRHSRWLSIGTLFSKSQSILCE